MFFSMMAIDINYVRVFIIQIYLQPKRDTGYNLKLEKLICISIFSTCRRIYTKQQRRNIVCHIKNSMQLNSRKSERKSVWKSYWTITCWRQPHDNGTSIGTGSNILPANFRSISYLVSWLLTSLGTFEKITKPSSNEMNKPVLGKNLQMENSIVYPMYANPKTVKRCNTAKPHANSLMPIDENTEIYSGDCKRSRNWFAV